MRINIFLRVNQAKNKNRRAVPSIDVNDKAKIVNQQLYQKWLDKESGFYHNKFSTYNTSGLIGGRMSKFINRIEFNSGNAEIKISSPDRKFMETLIAGIRKHPFVNVENNFVFDIVDVRPEYFEADAEEMKFFACSPILIQDSFKVDGKRRYYTFQDDPKITTEFLNRTLKNRIEAANLDIDVSNLNVKFDSEYKDAKTKTVSYKRNGSTLFLTANSCPVIITGNQASLAAAYYLGIGHSTGAGFGCITNWKNLNDFKSHE